MSLDNVRNLHESAPTRDEIEEIKRQGIRKYVSPWVRIDEAASYSFPHGLGEIPVLTSVLSATDSQGTEQAEATSVTVTTTVNMVAVANAGAARFFRVRAF
jgi:hypothetical protein